MSKSNENSPEKVKDLSETATPSEEPSNKHEPDILNDTIKQTEDTLKSTSTLGPTHDNVDDEKDDDSNRSDTPLLQEEDKVQHAVSKQSAARAESPTIIKVETQTYPDIKEDKSKGKDIPG